jgi:O-antigen/teichoic acid export membrane protein
VVRWLALYAAMLSLAQLVYTALNSIGRPRATTLLRLLHLVTLVVLLAVLVRHGIVAVAVGQAVAGLVAALAGLVVGARTLPGLRMARLLRALLPAAGGAAAMTTVALILHSAFPHTVVSVSGLFLVGVPALAAYHVPVFLLGRADLARVAHALRGRS